MLYEKTIMSEREKLSKFFEIHTMVLESRIC